MNALFETIFETPRASGFVRVNRRSEVLEELAYEELVASSRRRAGVLRSALANRASVEPVGLVFADPLAFVEALFTCVYLGWPAVPVAPRQLAWSAAALDAAGVGLMVVEDELAPRLSRWLDGWSTLVWGQRRVRGVPGEMPPMPSAEHEPVLVQLSSGTTGDPTPVALSAGNIVNNERAIARHFGHEAGSRILGWLPHFHDMGLFGTLLQPFFVDCVGYLGTPLDFVRDPLSWLRNVSHHRITTTGAPTFAYQRCAQTVADVDDIDLGGWRIAFVGAEPVRASVMARFCDRFAAVGFDPRALLACYGLAEATLFVAGEEPGRGLRTLPDRAAQRVGLEPVDEELVRVGSAPDTGAAHVRLVDVGLGPGPAHGGVGEIQISGPSVARPCRDRSTPGDWLATGDLGLIRDGGLYICGRLKEVVTIRGRNVALAEIDRWVESLLDDPSIEVCTMRRIRRRAEDSLGVLLQPRDETGPPIGAPEVRRRVSAAVRSRLGSPVEVVLCPSRPRLILRTPSGKLRRAATCAAIEAAGMFDD